MSTFKIDFGSGFDVTESPADEFNIVLDLSEITAAGELGGTYPNPTVDATHAGSAHHAEAHTIPSHSDTTATGAELEELTDGSQTALHSHAGSGPTTVYKTADETVNNSTTLQDDDHISLSVLANEVWAFHMVLHSSSDATPDIKVGWSVPSGTTMSWRLHSSTGTANDESDTDQVSGSGVGVTMQDTYGGTIIVGGTAGTVQMRWAQKVAHASDAKILKGSYLIAWKLS